MSAIEHNLAGTYDKNGGPRAVRGIKFRDLTSGGEGALKRTAALLGSLALWLVAAGSPGDQPVARWVGGLIFHLLAALLITWLFVRKQEPRPSLWSPWLLLVAAGIALLGRFSQPG